MLLLYRSLIGSVLEYGSICYAEMARTHMLLLERVQYRALRINGPNGIYPQQHSGCSDDTDCFILISDTLSILFRRMGTQSAIGLIPFHEVSGLDIQPEVGYTRHELRAILSTPRVNRHMEVAFSGVHADMYRIVTPLELWAGIALFSSSNLLYTNGSLMDGVAGFAVHHSIDCNIGLWMRGSASVFTAELAAIHMAMDQIENEALGRYLILKDSRSSIRTMESRKISLHTNPFVYECKQKCWQLARSGHEVSFIWVPAHV
jgi:hypothetical protein